MKLFEQLDVGTLLPGCSVPVTVVDGHGVHAFREFRPLPIDGLSKSARRRVANSIPAVISGLHQLHEAGYIDGRITSARMYNHGTDAAPAATLWIDDVTQTPDDKQGSDVHAGDPESMYWNASRLKSGADATESDDWYAMGVVLAELALTSEAVRKIWELSQQDGRFVESLVKNVKHAAAPRSLKRAAVKLIRQGDSGVVDAATIQSLSAVTGREDRKLTYALLGLSAALLAALLWAGFRREKEIDSREKQLSVLEQRVDELQTRADELASRPPEVITVMEEKGGAGRRENSLAAKKARWTKDVAERSLEDVVGDAAHLQPAEWVKVLAELHGIAGQKQWRFLDQKLRRDVQALVNQPWDDANRNRVRARLESLGSAQRRWQSWARSGRSLAEIQTKHGLMPSGLEKDFLGQWLGELLDVRELDVKVRVIMVPAENEFSAHLATLETDDASLTEKWLWDSPSGKEESIRLTLDPYKPDQSVQFWMQQDSSIPYWNTTVIEHTFQSPLLVWQLQTGLQLSNGESGYTLLLSTGTKYGPPASLDSERVADAPAPQVRKTVDPLKELPIGLD